MVRVDGRQIDWHEGMTVADLLRELGDGHRCPVVRLGDRLITHAHFHNSPVPDDAELHLLHLIAGG